MSTANTPQHIFDQGGTKPVPSEDADRIKPTGPNTAAPDRDVADPHPANEENFESIEHPGGAHPPTKDIGPNPAVHGGKAPPRPHNSGSGAQ